MFQHEKLLPRCRVPDLDGCIPTRGGEAFPVGAERHAPDVMEEATGFVPFERERLLPRLSVPYLDCSVIARGGEPAPIRAERHAPDRIGVTLEAEQRPPRLLREASRPVRKRKEKCQGGDDDPSDCVL